MNERTTRRDRCGIALAWVAACAIGAWSCSETTADARTEPSAGEPQDPQPAPAETGNVPLLRLVPAMPTLRFVRPIFITHAGDGSGRLFVVEQGGRIRVVTDAESAEAAPVFLDLRAKVRRRHNEEGLLALAFHPDYETNRHLYVYYTASKPRRGVLARFTASAEDPNRVETDSEHVILEVEQPWGNHNGSTVLFGPDGYLYVSLGDGGSAGDPQGNGQNLATWLGSILRIDVDHAEGDRAYRVPEDNPFVDRAGALPEIWAYGFRNVWRMSFDRETGDLWGGDVGQNRWEEIDLIVKGGNYGWNRREGRHEFPGGRGQAPSGRLMDPIYEYPQYRGREVIGRSVTGGYVYRGTQIESLVGAYVFADYVSGRIWALRVTEGAVTAAREVVRPAERTHVSSFGEGPDGELYLCAFDRLDGEGGRIYRLAGR